MRKIELKRAATLQFYADGVPYGQQHPLNHYEFVVANLQRLSSATDAEMKHLTDTLEYITPDFRRFIINVVWGWKQYVNVFLSRPTQRFDSWLRFEIKQFGNSVPETLTEMNDLLVSGGLSQIDESAYQQIMAECERDKNDRVLREQVVYSWIINHALVVLNNEQPLTQDEQTYINDMIAAQHSGLLTPLIPSAMVNVYDMVAKQFPPSNKSHRDINLAIDGSMVAVNVGEDQVGEVDMVQFASQSSTVYATDEILLQEAVDGLFQTVGVEMLTAHEAAILAPDLADSYTWATLAEDRYWDKQEVAELPPLPEIKFVEEIAK